MPSNRFQRNIANPGKPPICHKPPPTSVPTLVGASWLWNNGTYLTNPDWGTAYKLPDQPNTPPQLTVVTGGTNQPHCLIANGASPNTITIECGNADTAGLPTCYIDGIQTPTPNSPPETYIWSPPIAPWITCTVEIAGVLLPPPSP